MILRRQLPVASPISPAAVLRASVAALLGTVSVSDARTLLLQRYGAMAAALTDSGTSALVLALRLAVPGGGIVALPGYACVDVAAAAIRAGVKVRFYDTDPSTLSPDLESVERVLQRGVSAIVVAHIFGYAADVLGVRTLAVAHGATVIEDAAQGAGGTLHGCRLGSLGDLAVLSFGRGKGMSAGGGGALLAFDTSWSSRVNDITLPPAGRGMSALPKLAGQWALGRPALYILPSMLPWLHLGEMVYHEAGEPGSLSDVSRALLPAAVALEQHELAVRRRNAAALESRAALAPRIGLVQPIAGSQPGYLRYAVRDAGGERLTAHAYGVVRPYPRTLAEHHELASARMAGEPGTPLSVELSRTLFTLPVHGMVRSRDFDALDAWLCPTVE